MKLSTLIKLLLHTQDTYPCDDPEVVVRVKVPKNNKLPVIQSPDIDIEDYIDKKKCVVVLKIDEHKRYTSDSTQKRR